MIRQLFCAATLTAAAAVAAPADAQKGAPSAPPPEAADGVCAAISSSDWRAFVDAAPASGGGPVLVITGTVDLPTPAHRIEARLGPTDRRSPPGQVIAVEIVSDGGVAAQVITSRAVRFEFHAIDTQYHRVTIACGGQTLAELADVGPAV